MRAVAQPQASDFADAKPEIDDLSRTKSEVGVLLAVAAALFPGTEHLHDPRSLASPTTPHEAMLFSNIDDGYLEGLLRGYRAGILTSTDYQNLSQCETIDGAPRAKLRNSRPYSRGRRRARAIALCGPAAAGPLVSSAPFPLCGPALSPPRAPFPPQT